MPKGAMPDGSTWAMDEEDDKAYAMLRQQLGAAANVREVYVNNAWNGF